MNKSTTTRYSFWIILELLNWLTFTVLIFCLFKIPHFESWVDCTWIWHFSILQFCYSFDYFFFWRSVSVGLELFLCRGKTSGSIGARLVSGSSKCSSIFSDVGWGLLVPSLCFTGHNHVSFLVTSYTSFIFFCLAGCSACSCRLST